MCVKKLQYKHHTLSFKVDSSLKPTMCKLYIPLRAVRVIKHFGHILITFVCAINHLCLSLLLKADFLFGSEEQDNRTLPVSNIFIKACNFLCLLLRLPPPLQLWQASQCRVMYTSLCQSKSVYPDSEH